jgi:D-glutamate cyclase
MQYNQEILDKITHLETICGQDVGRGIQPLVQAAQGGLLGAARAIAEHPRPHVAIITGFFLPSSSPPAAETDGPIGCAQLAAGLIRADIQVRIVTDIFCFAAVKAAADLAGVPTSTAFDIIPVDGTGISSLLDAWELLGVTHAIAIERPGPGYDGMVRSMRGHDITLHTAPLHLLFNSPKIITVGIGDGGNELGMGKIPREIISQSIRHGEKIACATTCNYLIVCGVSNWGANALLIAVALLRPEWKFQLIEGLSIAAELHILKTLVDNSIAVDGVTGKLTLTVDNLAWEDYAKVLDSAIRVIE